MKDVFFQLAFSSFAFMTCASAFLVFFLRNLLHAAVALFFCLTGVAALYIMLGADFLGMAQLLIYAGGIIVLVIFGVFLTTRIYEKTKLESTGKKISALLGVIIALSLFGLVSMLLGQTQWPQTIGTYEPTTKGLGNLFLTRHLLAFELISILLLFAMVGAALLVKKEVDGDSV